MISQTQELLSLIKHRYEMTSPTSRGFMLFHTLMNVGEHIW